MLGFGPISSAPISSLLSAGNNFNDSIILSGNNNFILFADQIKLIYIADRVKEFSSTMGNGNIILSGAEPGGFRNFSSVIPIGARCTYCIQNINFNEFELGFAILLNSTTLIRDDIRTSSNLNSIVNFSAGIKDVFINMPAFILVNDEAFNLVLGN